VKSDSWASNVASVVRPASSSLFASNEPSRTAAASRGLSIRRKYFGDRKTSGAMAAAPECRRAEVSPRELGRKHLSQIIDAMSGHLGFASGGTSACRPGRHVSCASGRLCRFSVECSRATMQGQPGRTIRV
jgi:hypothetical protein